MKRILVVVLLLSLGLNVGLGARLWKNRSATAGRSDWNHKEHRTHSKQGESGAGQGHSGTLKKMMTRKLDYLTRELDLDPAQVELFKKSHQDNMEILVVQRNLVGEARRRLREAVEDSNLTTEDYRSLIGEVGRQQARMDSLVTETMLKEMDFMTAEQRRKYLSILPVNRFGSGKGSGSRGSGRGQH